MANADLQQKKEEIEGLRDQLSDQYEKLVRQKRSFDTWTSECRDKVEHQAARLQARSDELDRRETEMGEHARSLQAEKLQLQQEIRRLAPNCWGSGRWNCRPSDRGYDGISSMGNRSILAARMKSFSVSPPTAWVQISIQTCRKPVRWISG